MKANYKTIQSTPKHDTLYIVVKCDGHIKQIFGVCRNIVFCISMNPSYEIKSQGSLVLQLYSVFAYRMTVT